MCGFLLFQEFSLGAQVSWTNKVWLKGWVLILVFPHSAVEKPNYIFIIFCLVSLRQWGKSTAAYWKLLSRKNIAINSIFFLSSYCGIVSFPIFYIFKLHYMQWSRYARNQVRNMEQLLHKERFKQMRTQLEMGKLWADLIEWMVWRVWIGTACSPCTRRTWKGASDEGTWFRTHYGAPCQRTLWVQKFMWIWGEIEQMFGKVLNRSKLS